MAISRPATRRRASCTAAANAAGPASRPASPGHLFGGVTWPVTGPNGDAQWFGGLLESAPDAMVVVHEGGIVAMVNTQAERMFGYGRDELVGQPLESLLPERIRPGHSERLAEYLADPEVRVIGSHRELVAQRRNGEEFPVEIGLSPFRTNVGTFVTASLRDISARA